jgi:hypothetical protein
MYTNMVSDVLTGASFGAMRFAKSDDGLDKHQWVSATRVTADNDIRFTIPHAATRIIETANAATGRLQPSQLLLADD